MIQFLCWKSHLSFCLLTVMKGDKADLLASLCNMYDTSEDELRKTLEDTNNLIINILKKSPCLASERTSKNLETIITG